MVKVKKKKTVKRAVTVYAQNFGFREPYQILGFISFP